MINLVKNELIKISHRKGIYLYMAFILVMFGLIVVFDSESGSYMEPPELVTYKETEGHLSTFDLNNPDDVMVFIGEKVNVEVGKILEKYNIDDYNSVEYYYVSTEIKPVLEILYSNMYQLKDEESVAMYQEELNELVANINNFDWKKSLKEDKEELKAELESAETDKEKKIIEDKILAIDYRLKNDIAPSYGDSPLISRFLSASSDYYYVDKDEKDMKHAEKVAFQEKKKAYYESKYKIENNWVQKNSFDEIFYIFSEASMDFLLAIILIAGGIVAEEFNKGTIKQLFVRPFSRWKILTSKIIASFIAFLAYVVFYVVVMIIVETIMGADVKTLFDAIPIYNFNTEQVVEYSSLAYLGINFLAILPEYIFYLLVCIFVGVLTTNTVASIAAVIALQLIPVLIPFTDKVAAYLPFNNFNFNKYLFGGIPLNHYQTLGSSIAVALLTVVILMIIMYYIFKKKDVKNQ